jgi:hypothetical protein
MIEFNSHKNKVGNIQSNQAEFDSEKREDENFLFL